jgi:predicted DNA-binding protein
MMERRRKLYSFWIDPDVADHLKRLKARTGRSESDQIRSAIEAWLQRAEQAAKRARKGGGPKKRRA